LPLKPKRYLDRGGLLDELIAHFTRSSLLGNICGLEYHLGSEGGQSQEPTCDSDRELFGYRIGWNSENWRD